ncbi:MAG: thiamine biosynthesis lipoprotein ApbE [Ilumatobacteraceae bacterium]|nr:thiamine biosynthesis lipoprotein ApbE [Ilumatobacteraceae bacterium]
MEAERHTDHHFRAMGTDCHVVVVGGPADAAPSAIARILQLESRWSRFLPSSEISELNRRAGSAVPVSPDTALLLQRSVEAWWLTGSSFDPTVLGSMVRAGYDRTFTEVAADPRRGASELDLGCTDIVIELDDDGWSATLPIGTGFDPGGIGKGLAADLVVTQLLDAGVDGACVNLGGDLRIAGSGPSGRAWTVAIDHPGEPEPLALVGLSSGAIATSTTLLRRWDLDGRAANHVIDPETGLPTATDVALVAVIAGEAWMAEVLATACLLRGVDRVFDLLDGTCQAIAVGNDGTRHTTAGFDAFTRTSDDDREHDREHGARTREVVPR